MKFLTATHTDVGTRKKTNQDSMLVLQAQTDAGPVLMAAVCDGMGGLAKGEVASAAMVRALSDWFQTKLPTMLATGFNPEHLRSEWENLVTTTGQRIAAYGAGIHVDLGTTAVVFLAVGNSYYIMNVGDSRVYLINDAVYQLTKDQTYVQREMDLGHMTMEQAMQDPKRSVLLQCIGASPVIRPDFVSGPLQPEQVYMLCCDGFRHVIQPQEFQRALNPRAIRNDVAMKKAARELTELNKARGEDDNISVILIRTA